MPVPVPLAAACVMFVVGMPAACNSDSKAEPPPPPPAPPFVDSSSPIADWTELDNVVESSFEFNWTRQDTVKNVVAPSLVVPLSTPVMMTSSTPTLKPVLFIASETAKRMMSSAALSSKAQRPRSVLPPLPPVLRAMSNSAYDVVESDRGGMHVPHTEHCRSSSQSMSVSQY